MDWGSSRFTFFSKVLNRSLKIGAGASATVVLGVAIYHKFNSPNNVAASWTTNYEPTKKWNNNWDRRDPAIAAEPAKSDSVKDLNDFKNQVKKNTPTASRHLILIRHGQYFDKEKEDTSRVLTELGRLQADVTGQRLKMLELPYTSLTASTMVRAQETAQLIAAHVPLLDIQYDDSLREGAPIPPEPQIGNYRPEKKQFFQDGARIESAFRKYFHRADPQQLDDSFEIIVCHSNVIRYFICRALQLYPEAWLRFSLAHASITHVVIRPSGRVSIRAVGDHGHFHPEKITFS